MDKAELTTLIKSTQNAEDLQQIADVVSTLPLSEREAMKPILEEMTDRFLAKAKETVSVVKVFMQLENVSDYISLSYVASRFLGKSRSWLHNKIKCNFSNGKPVAFSEVELRTLQKALSTLSDELKQTSLQLSY